ncbi:EAL domain-containing protein [Ferrimonas senticii]|uniref:EAL domain-containing protein n=1 Tax=Ferrimonas senticii TaxID=394566 RepID=UPI000421647E|nr:EAL domain-containing protein [Ferrimonas senticii]
MSLRLILLLLTFALGIAAHASPYQRTLRSTEFGLEQGLSQTSVIDIEIDAFGFIWVATINGIDRFNGHRFESFALSDDPNNPLVFAYNLLLDDLNTLWAFTNIGTFYFDQQRQQFIKRHHLSWLQIQAHTQAQGQIVLLSGQQLIRLSRDNTNTETVDAAHSSKLWFAKGRPQLQLANGQILDLDNRQQREQAPPTRTFNLAAQTLHQSPQGVRDSNGQLLLPDHHPSALIRHQQRLYRLEQGNLFMHRWPDAQAIPASQAEQLTIDGQVRQFRLASNGDLWLQRHNRPLQRLSQPALPLPLYQPQQANTVWSMVPYQAGWLVASEQPELQWLSRELQPLGQFTAPMAGPKALCVANQQIFIGGYGGLYQLTPGPSSQSTRLWGNDDDIVTHISHCNDGQLQFGSFNGEVLQLTVSQPQQLTTLAEIGQQRPIFVLKSWQQQLLIGSQLGLTLIDESTPAAAQANQQPLTLLNNQMVTVIEPDQQQLWIGSSNGLYRYRRGEPPKRLLTDPIYSSQRHGNRLYLGSGKQLLVFDLTSEQLHYRYNQRQGAQLEYHSMASSQHHDGGMLFSGNEGLNTLDPQQHYHRPALPTPFISGFNLFDRPAQQQLNLATPLHQLQQLSLAADEYPFAFEFSDFSGVDEVEYSYRLLGDSEHWLTMAKQHSASFTRLASGSYQLQFRYRLPPSTQYSAINSVAIEIAPTPLQSPPALAAYAAITLLFATLLGRSWHRRRQLQRQIQQNEERLKLSLWGSGDEIWDWDIRAQRVYRSNMWRNLQLSGAQPHASSGMDCIHPADRDRVSQALQAHLQQQSEHYQATYRVKDVNGDWVWLLDRGKVVERDQQQQPLRMTGTIKDISDSKRAEQRLSLFELALTNVSDGMAILDPKFRFLEVNEACCQISGFSRTATIGKVVDFERVSPQVIDNIRDIAEKFGHWHGDIEFRRSNNDLLDIAVQIDRMDEVDSDKHYYVLILRDITHRKRAERELRRLSNTDGLTGLPNRSYLQANIEGFLSQQQPFALLLFDLDNFRQLNDAVGHSSGDELLKQVAARLKQHVATATMLYRIGGDEFALLVPAANHISNSATIAQNVLTTLVEPFQVNQRNQHISASIGIVHHPEDDHSMQELLRKADLAMYHAKSQGGNCYQFYSESLNQQLQQRVEQAHLLRQALALDWFEVHYQPKYASDDLSINGMEALVRMRLPDGSLRPPLEFITLAEETGQIIAIGEIVLRQACRFSQTLLASGELSGRVAVNLSPKQLLQSDFAEQVQQILQQSQLPARYLELEITESAIIDEPKKVIANLIRLRQLGVKLSLDDFGTGYSAMSYLKTLPLDTLKIDKSFIDNITTSRKERSMVRSIITLAHNLDLTVVAEGVETSDQLQQLLKMECDTLQGTLFSAPLSGERFRQLQQSKQFSY